MVGYSARLALVTTLVGMIFSGLARLPVWEAAVLVAMPFWFVSCWRILRQRRAWLDPVQRVRMTDAAGAAPADDPAARPHDGLFTGSVEAEHE